MSEQPEGLLSIADLVRQSGVPPATIHHYLRLGLLPQPYRLARNRFGYDERHLRALQIVRRLRARRSVSLAAIRRALPDLMALEGEEAFRPEMWERVMAPSGDADDGAAGRLVRAAKDALAVRPLSEVNVDELCRAAGIAKGSFYRHFRSKEDLLVAAARSMGSDIVDEFRAGSGKGRVSARRAQELMGASIARRLPLFLDLLAGSLRGHDDYGAALREVVQNVAARTGALITGPGGAVERGADAMGAAIAEVGRWAVLPTTPETSGGPAPSN